MGWQRHGHVEKRQKNRQASHPRRCLAHTLTQRQIDACRGVSGRGHLAEEIWFAPADEAGWMRRKRSVWAALGRNGASLLELWTIYESPSSERVFLAGTSGGLL